MNDSIQGSIERITFHNPENGFCVLKIAAEHHADLVCLIGYLSNIVVGEYIRATGQWVKNSKFGAQFKSTQIDLVLPSSLKGIEKFLSSGFIKGIGPHYAKLMVKAFQEKLFDVIDNEPERIKKIPGIGSTRYKIIIESWNKHKSIRDLMVFLHQYHIGSNRAIRIFRLYGKQSIEKIKENPYCLAQDVKGIGFTTADHIAQKMGIEKNSPLRLRAGIHHILLESLSEGHTAFPRAELIERAIILLESDQESIEKVLIEEIKAKEIIQEVMQQSNFLFIKIIYQIEKTIAENIKILRHGVPAWPEKKWTKETKEVEKINNIQLAHHQKEAIYTVLHNKITVITGGPGVGKTTIINSLLTLLKPYKLKIFLAAPTGRAAKRLQESTGVEAKTLHRLLEIDPSSSHQKYDRHHPLNCDLLIVDETSMIDCFLMQTLVKSLSYHTALVFVGDVDQLPSVGPGQILNDLIISDFLPVARLTEIFRQSKNSHIIQNAHRINDNKMPYFPENGEESDFYFVSSHTPEEGMHKLIKMMIDRIPHRFGYNPLTDVQILTPMNKGVFGTENLNRELKAHLINKDSLTIEKYGSTFSVGDKVMQTENNYDKDVFNGDMGYITEINQQEQLVYVCYDTRQVFYEFEELDQLTLAYAITIHKSQGSEFDVVIVPVMMQHYTMLRKKLIYTAITRGKKLVILIGQKKALAVALNQQAQEKRWTKLNEWFTNEAIEIL